MYVIRLCAIEHGEKKYFVTPTVLRLQFRYPSPRLFGISHCNIRTLSSIISKVCLEVRQFSKILPVLCQRSVTRHQQSLATGAADCDVSGLLTKGNSLGFLFRILCVKRKFKRQPRGLAWK
ncbi:unnamed protein product [Allacma fusca]|uniref:Uncharacterized protein n=1 Tax=Allacma fusca TaxID=39272 RepID=A0A8J2NQT1_9HEXA|nr:unnamed protein product [Allacma fusca]